MHDVLPTEWGVGATEHETKTIHMKMDSGWNPEEAVKTVLHEIAHALMPKGEGHGRRWAQTLISLDSQADRDHIVFSMLHETLTKHDTKLGHVPEEIREYYRFCFDTANLDSGKLEERFTPEYLARIEGFEMEVLPVLRAKAQSWVWGSGDE